MVQPTRRSRSFFSPSNMHGGGRNPPIPSHSQRTPTPTSLHAHGLEDVIDRFSSDPTLLSPYYARDRLTPSPGLWNGPSLFPDSPLLGWGQNVELPPSEEYVGEASGDMEEESREHHDLPPPRPLDDSPPVSPCLDLPAPSAEDLEQFRPRAPTPSAAYSNNVDILKKELHPKSSRFISSLIHQNTHHTHQHSRSHDFVSPLYRRPDVPPLPTMLTRSFSQSSPLSRQEDRAHTSRAPKTPPSNYRLPNLNATKNSVPALGPSMPFAVSPSEAFSTPPTADTSDRLLEPYPYLSQQHPHQQHLATTPPISLSSGGSSSARSSSAFASTHSAVRSSVASASSISHRSDDHHSGKHAHAHSGMPMVGREQSFDFPNSHFRHHPDDSNDVLDDRGDEEHEDEEQVSHDAHSLNAGVMSDAAAHLANAFSFSSMTSDPRPFLTYNPDPANTRFSGSGYSFGGTQSARASVSDTSGFRVAANADWGTHNEREEHSLTTDDETDLEDEEEENIELERTAAIVIAEEGRGLIVHGEGVPVSSLDIQRGTTHLLLGSSSTPNHIPSFLNQVLPVISYTLLALDISCNYLTSLPPALATCEALEELNITSNPLRVLPSWISNLVRLRVLIADATGCATLPHSLSSLTTLHTLSLRRNRLYSLPHWLCKLTALETLLIDGNPFLGPWRTLLEPLYVINQTPLTPAYPPNTPNTAVSGASIFTNDGGTSTPQSMDSAEEEAIFASAQSTDMTVTYANQSLQPRSVTAPTSRNVLPQPAPRSNTSPLQTMSAYASTPQLVGSSSSQLRPPPATRARTYSRPKTAADIGDQHLRSFQPDFLLSPPKSDQQLPDDHVRQSEGREKASLRKMKSADELRRVMSKPEVPPKDPGLLDRTPRRFGTMGARRSGKSDHRTGLPGGWPGTAEEEEGEEEEVRISADVTGPPHLFASFPPPPPEPPLPPIPLEKTVSSTSQHSRHPRAASPTDDATSRRSGKWGFFKKKISMGRIRSGSGSANANANGSKEVGNGTILSRTATSYSRTSSANSHPSRSSTPSVPPVPPLKPGLGLAIPTTVPPTPTVTSSGSPQLPALSLGAANGSLSGTDFLRPKASAEALLPPTPSSSSMLLAPPSPQPRSGRRRSFLPIDGPPSLSIPIPNTSPFLSTTVAFGGSQVSFADSDADKSIDFSPNTPMYHDDALERQREGYARALRSVLAYLRDMSDLTAPTSGTSSPTEAGQHPISPPLLPVGDDGLRRQRRPPLASLDTDRVQSTEGSFASSSTPSHSQYNSPQLRSEQSSLSLRGPTLSMASADSGGSGGGEDRKYKSDKGKRAMIVKEIVETERTYVKGLQELVDIYIKPSANPAGVLGNKETVIPVPERKIVFNGLDSLLSFHKESFLPSLEKALAPLANAKDTNGEISSAVARGVAMVFLTHAAFMRMYSTYINNFDNSIQRLKQWSAPAVQPNPSPPTNGPSSVSQLAGIGLTMTAVAIPSVPSSTEQSNMTLTTSQKRRMKTFLKRCRLNPRHSQLNLESYLLLPIQRIPRYRLLLEELVRCTPPKPDELDDALERALQEISSLANNMNEGKRESESRRKLVQWQARIRGKFPSPLVQPHRRLILDGQLYLSRVVRKTTDYFEIINSEGDKTLVQVDCLAPESNPRTLVAILCNDLLVLCKDPSGGKDSNSPVDLWAVLRMQTLPQPASIVHGNALRLVDNKAILYFDADSTSELLTWSRAINMHIPSSK